jgi:hypothetical protein
MFLTISKVKTDGAVRQRTVLIYIQVFNAIFEAKEAVIFLTQEIKVQWCFGSAGNSLLY